MAGSQLSLNETAAVTLNGSGAGTVRLSPDEPAAHWLPDLVSVKCSSNNNEATCIIYCGNDTSDANFVDGTFSGSSGDATDKIKGYDVSRTTNAYIFAVWTGGDPGAQATMIISGQKVFR